MNQFISILEGIYIFYMFVLFKTSYSINHPFEKDWNISMLKHPISSTYESKICPLGKITGVFLLLWFIFRYKIKNNNRYNILILTVVGVSSLLLNLNALVYLLPILFIEYFKTSP